MSGFQMYKNKLHHVLLDETEYFSGIYRYVIRRLKTILTFNFPTAPHKIGKFCKLILPNSFDSITWACDVFNGIDIPTLRCPLLHLRGKWNALTNILIGKLVGAITSPHMCLFKKLNIAILLSMILPASVYQNMFLMRSWFYKWFDGAFLVILLWHVSHLIQEQYHPHCTMVDI